MVAAEAPEITVAFQIVKQRKREDQGANHGHDLDVIYRAGLLHVDF